MSDVDLYIMKFSSEVQERLMKYAIPHLMFLRVSMKEYTLEFLHYR